MFYNRLRLITIILTLIFAGVIVSALTSAEIQPIESATSPAIDVVTNFLKSHDMDLVATDAKISIMVSVGHEPTQKLMSSYYDGTFLGYENVVQWIIDPLRLTEIEEGIVVSESLYHAIALAGPPSRVIETSVFSIFQVKNGQIVSEHLYIR